MLKKPLPPQSIEENKRSKNLLWQYAGLATQMLVAIGIAVFVGMKADDWLKFSTPILVWCLPLALIVLMLVRVIIDTSRKK